MSTRTDFYARNSAPQGLSSGRAPFSAESLNFDRSLPPGAERVSKLNGAAKDTSPSCVVWSISAGSTEPPRGKKELRLLHHTAELANAALCLSEGVTAIHSFLAQEFGWTKAGWRVLGEHVVQRDDLVDAGSSIEHWRLLNGDTDPHAWAADAQAVLLRVEDGDRTLALLAFWVPQREIGRNLESLLGQVVRQLQALAKRDVFRHGVLSREFEILRQGQLAGMAELAQGLSHELSQPLTALAAYAGALQRKLVLKQHDNQDIAYLGERLLQQVERAGAILQAAKSFILQHTAATGTVDVEATVKQLKKLVQPSLQAASVELVFEVAKGLPPARGSEAHVVQIMLGLLANSMVALQLIAACQRRITIQVSRVEREVQISVIDSGQHAGDALAEDLLPFFTAYSDSSRISLSISRSLAEIQGGRLWRESNSEGETVYRVALPLMH